MSAQPPANESKNAPETAHGGAVTRYVGLVGSSKAWQIAQLAQRHGSIFVLSKNSSSAAEFVNDLSAFCVETSVSLFPSWETIPFEPVSPQRDVSAQRLAVLDHLLRREKGIVVAPADAVMQRLVPLRFVQDFSIDITVGQDGDIGEIARRLAFAGYQAVSLVEARGEMALRGAVLDVFPGWSSKPLRIHFTAGRISDVRTFNPEDQRTVSSLHSARIPPAQEHVPIHAPHYEGEIREALASLKERGRQCEAPPREIARVISAVRSGAILPGIELFDAVFVRDWATVFDYLQPHTLVCFDNDAQCLDALDSFASAVSERAALLKSQHVFFPAEESLYMSAQEVLTATQRFARAFLDHLDMWGSPADSNDTRVQVRVLHNTELHVQLKTRIGSGNALAPLKRFVERARRDSMSIAFVVGSEERAAKLQKILLQIDIDARVLEVSLGTWLRLPHRYPVVIAQAQLSAGFQLPEEHLVFVAEHEVFAERSQRKSKRSKLSIKRLLGSLALLSEGDFVVHTDYGIGRYRGLKNLLVAGSEGDFLHIEYADTVLYLPVHQIGKVQKYSAEEGAAPQLDKLASKRWVRTKEKVRASVMTLAGDLIKLYATRSVIKGWRFDPAGAEDERFSEDFAYEETPDQRKAIQQTLADMAAEKPMDRLVCGDVGFGKTEVAIRAAFKCSQHGKQTAVLVPTTILVEQHKNTFQRRFHDYPVSVGAVSRFYSPQQNKKTLADLACGELDVIIGTHRLLSRDVQFKDLGLLIIDEEHRFGVSHKERLKALKKQVDVLTLTATPIPRTLHMSLLGIRDISLISTPPQDRRVIRSYIAAYDDSLVRNAILRELQRGGQSFFVHNRVESIDAVTARLSELVPEARFAFAHGQMSERELENIMQRFLERSIDVLVSTSIIESGLDIPRANTILIDRADTFGLAQLYQLRGRVGRSHTQAYAYFLVPKARTMSVDAQRRLKALQALDDLGLGFNLAVRDMEIRGAGNLLGKEQSGSVLAVGFELYSKILKEAILNLKGESIEARELVDPEMRLGIPAYLPPAYVPDVSERLVLYQRLSGIESPSDAEDLRAEALDRFGPLPPEAENLVALMRFRSLLREYGVARIDASRERIIISFSTSAPIDAEKLLALTRSAPDRLRFGKNLSLAISTPNPLSEIAHMEDVARNILVAVRREAPPDHKPS